jgi:hypothetical protein
MRGVTGFDDLERNQSYPSLLIMLHQPLDGIDQLVIQLPLRRIGRGGTSIPVELARAQFDDAGDAMLQPIREKGG